MSLTCLTKVVQNENETFSGYKEKILEKSKNSEYISYPSEDYIPYGGVIEKVSTVSNETILVGNSTVVILASILTPSFAELTCSSNKSSIRTVASGFLDWCGGRRHYRRRSGRRFIGRATCHWGSGFKQKEKIHARVQLPSIFRAGI